MPSFPAIRTLSRLLALAVLAGLRGPSAYAQADGLRLQRSIQPVTRSVQDQAPLFVRGERVEGVTANDITITGRAELRKPGLVLNADRIDYSFESNEAEALGNVHLLANQDEITGPRLRMRVDTQIGVIDEPRFSLAPRPPKRVDQLAPAAIRGVAESIRLDGEDRYRVTSGEFTSCKPGDEDWFMRAGEIDLNFVDEVGEARNARLTFKGISTPNIPWVTFSLSNGRKSGFLPPSFGISGKTGAEMLLPFYLNLAPNYDATVTTRFMATRGPQFLNEFRYLQPRITGIFNYEYMPHDRPTGLSRSAFNWTQVIQPTTSSPWSSLININRVSDDNYFRDLSGRLSVATQVYLPREGSVSYPVADGVAAILRVQRFQTLQDPLAPVLAPYARVPQVFVNALRPNVLGLPGADFNLASEYVDFEHPTLPLGRRASAYPSLAYPIISPGAYITPKVGVHVTKYSLSRLEASGDPLVQGAADSSPTRIVPIASFDSGLAFERNVTFRGLDLVNTLEPRLYYLYVPYRNQERIPLFDTGVADFNYAQIFSENYYSGGDRISDANQVTFAITSRLLRSDNGQETLRGLIGQRYYFSPQRVSLSSSTPTRADNLSSYLLGLSGQVAPRVTSEFTGQFSAETRRPERYNAAIRYQPELGKVLSLGYRFTNAALNPNPIPVGATAQTDIRQFDVATQWPMGRGWYLIGRYNYSVVSHRAIETLAGFEYNGGCWVVRAVAQKFVTASNTQTTQFFLQLELDGFARIGTNPLEALRRNVPGYSLLNSPQPNRQLDLYE